jgi:hypothetical protein
LAELTSALKINTVDSVVLDHFYFAHYRKVFDDSHYLRQNSVTQPTTVGILFNVKSQADLLQCIKKWAFVTHLKIADDLAESINHTTDSGDRDMFVETAQHLFGDADMQLIIVGVVLIALAVLIAALDNVITRIRGPKAAPDSLHSASHNSTADAHQNSSAHSGTAFSAL